ncbi:NAD(P)H-dependent oxidoreductase [Gilvimarinus sp. F26214L]|uniref:NAD(P)H-dependent oxidoreductase n=1 Tax=Gilvimarinus sp. DZF01 TaxID=3461371 RepID=UPI004045B2BA
MKRILVIQGHPDFHTSHLGHGLANAYVQGAGAAGHEVQQIAVAKLDFSMVRSQKEWAEEQPPQDIQAAQEAIGWAEHIVIFYPLWLGTMPAIMKAFLEQVMRPGFALDDAGERGTPKKRLHGKSARVVITMGMPAVAYRWFFRAHSLKSLERNILKFVGIKPVRETLIGMVENASAKQRARWMKSLQNLGARAA